MPTTMNVRGQVVIPRHIRDRLGLVAGDRLDLELGEDGSIRMRPVRAQHEGRDADHFGPLVGMRRRGENTDAWLDLLRRYSEDVDDPGFR